MAIKYIVLPESKTTIGVLHHTKYDCVRAIKKMLNGTGLSLENEAKYYMPVFFKTQVTCDPLDEYDEEVGKQMVKEKLMRNYYDSLDKRLNVFKNSIVATMEEISRNFDESI